MDVIPEAISSFVEWLQGINLSQNFWENALVASISAVVSNVDRVFKGVNDRRPKYVIRVKIHTFMST